MQSVESSCASCGFVTTIELGDANPVCAICEGKRDSINDLEEELIGPRIALRLQTERLILREFADADIDRVVALSSEPESYRFILKKQKDAIKMREIATRKVQAAGRTDRTGYAFVVELGTISEVIGTIDVSGVWPRSTDASVGWHFGSAFSGNGYATEAARAILGFALAERGVSRIKGDCFAANLAVRRIFEKLGMRPRRLHWLTDPILKFAYGEKAPIVRYIIGAKQLRSS